MGKYGYAEEVWDAAKKEMKAALIARAKVRGMMPYSELTNGTSAAQFDPHSSALADMLGEISAEEDAEGRGMLSVIVVHKDGDMQPGPGFFEYAKFLGRDTSDILVCWVKELHVVHRAWAGNR